MRWVGIIALLGCSGPELVSDTGTEESSYYRETIEPIWYNRCAS